MAGEKGLFLILRVVAMQRPLIFQKRNEPVIFKAIKHGSVIENVYLDDAKTPDYYNTTLSENGRCCYPRSHIDDAVTENAAGEPETVIFLTCDLTGLIPPCINSF
jgi:phosphoenolpyruvate carboxykinase (ATP)